MRHKTVTILLRIRVGGHFVMSITKNHESHYVGALDNPPLPKFALSVGVTTKALFLPHGFEVIFADL